MARLRLPLARSGPHARIAELPDPRTGPHPGAGQPAERPEAPAEQELALPQTQLSTIPRTGRFSPAQTDADDAPAIDRPSPSSALRQLGSTS